MSRPNSRPRLTREAVVRHDARLDILCCLESSEPMTAAQINGRTGMDLPDTTYHLRLLRAFGLLGAARKEGKGPVRYSLRLDLQPEWVVAAVNEHREAAG